MFSSFTTFSAFYWSLSIIFLLALIFEKPLTDFEMKIRAKRKNKKK